MIYGIYVDNILIAKCDEEKKFEVLNSYLESTEPYKSKLSKMDIEIRFTLIKD